MPSDTTMDVLYAPTTMPSGHACIEMSTIYTRKNYVEGIGGTPAAGTGTTHRIGWWDWCAKTPAKPAKFAYEESTDDVGWLQNYTHLNDDGQRIYYFLIRFNSDSLPKGCWDAWLYNYYRKRYDHKYSSCYPRGDGENTNWLTKDEGWDYWEWKSDRYCPPLHNIHARRIQILNYDTGKWESLSGVYPTKQDGNGCWSFTDVTWDMDYNPSVFEFNFFGWAASEWTAKTDGGYLPPPWYTTNPVVHFQGTVNYLKLSVDASGTDNPNNVPLEYYWTWGDGTSDGWDPSPTTTHAYPSAGTRTVQLDVREVGTDSILSATDSFTMSDPPVYTVAVAMADSIRVGETATAHATVSAQDGTILTGRSVTWSASNGNVSISPNGYTAYVTGQSQGTVTLSATSEGVTGSKSVTVAPADSNVYRVMVAMVDSLGVGQTVTAHATTWSQDGTILTGRSITWTASNANVSITPNGYDAYVTGKVQGAVTISAISEGVTGSKSVKVIAPLVDDALAQGNSFPGDISQGQFVAVTVYMQNSGQNTLWSDDNGYSLKLVSPPPGGIGTWMPGAVSMGGTYTYPGNQHAFSFNLYTEANYNQSYDVYYQMAHSGTLFGGTNGRQITVYDPSTCVKYCTLAEAQVNPVRMVPGGGVGLENDVAGWPPNDASRDTLQQLTISNYTLNTRQENGVETGFIRYFDALGEPWGVDVFLTLRFEPGTINVGQLRKNVALSGYDLELVQANAGEVVVRFVRSEPTASLPAREMLLFEVPFTAPGGRSLPATLPSVTLTVTR